METSPSSNSQNLPPEFNSLVWKMTVDLLSPKQPFGQMTKVNNLIKLYGQDNIIYAPLPDGTTRVFVHERVDIAGDKVASERIRSDVEAFKQRQIDQAGQAPNS